MEIKECIKKIKKLEKLPDEKLKELLKKDKELDLEDILNSIFGGGFSRRQSGVGGFGFEKFNSNKEEFIVNLFNYNQTDREELLSFVLELKQLKSTINSLKFQKNALLERNKELENEQKILNEKILLCQTEKNNLIERIKFLEEKQSNIDGIVQEKISQQLKQYEEKIKQLEKENKELKEQLGYYE